MTVPRHEHEVWQLLDKIQMDMRGLNMRITELRSQIARLDLPDPQAHVCDKCGLKMRSASRLAEHRYVSHDGPLPHHYAAADTLAGDAHDANEEAA